MNFEIIKNETKNNKLRDVNGDYLHFSTINKIETETKNTGFIATNEFFTMIKKIWNNFNNTSYIDVAGDYVRIKANVNNCKIMDKDTKDIYTIVPYYFLNLHNGEVFKFYDAKTTATNKEAVNDFNKKYGIKTEKYNQIIANIKNQSTKNTLSLKKYPDFTNAQLNTATASAINLFINFMDGAEKTETKAKTAKTEKKQPKKTVA